MPRLTQAQRLARYRDRIDHSRRWRENEGYVELWKRLIDLYRGKTDYRLEDPTDKAMVNMAFAVHNIVVASVTTQFPKFTVAPNIIGKDDQATIAEAVLNYAWQHYEFHDEFQRAVIDASMIGHGWLKVGWRYVERSESRTLTPDEQAAQIAQGIADADRAAAEDPLRAADMPSDDEIIESVTPRQTIGVVEEDDPYVERVSPFDMVIDPEATDPRELRWIAQRTIRDLSAVREDESYDAAARHKVTADMSARSANDRYRDDRSDGTPDEDDDRVTVWEFYDLTENEWCVFAEAGDGFLIKPAEIPTERFSNPYLMFRDYDVPDTFYPLGEIESMESLQEELNKTRTQQINARKQYVRKFIAREAALNDRARAALSSEIDGDVVLVNEDDRPLGDLIIQAPALNFDPNMFNAHSQQLVQDMQLTTGLSDYQFGQMPDTRRLATEAMAVEGSTNARSSFKLSRFERTLAKVGRYLLGVMQQFMDTERVARVTGPGGEMLFVYTPDDIEGEFDLNVEAGSTQPKNDMIRRQEAVTLFNTLAPLMGTLINPQELIRYLLQQGYDIKNVDRFMMAPPPPMMPGAPPGAEGEMSPEMMGGGMGMGMPMGDMGMGAPPMGNGAEPMPVPM